MEKAKFCSNLYSAIIEIISIYLSNIKPQTGSIIGGFLFWLKEQKAVVVKLKPSKWDIFFQMTLHWLSLTLKIHHARTKFLFRIRRVFSLKVTSTQFVAKKKIKKCFPYFLNHLIATVNFDAAIYSIVWRVLFHL